MAKFRDEGHGPYVVSRLNEQPICTWYMARLVDDNKQQIDLYYK